MAFVANSTQNIRDMLDAIGVKDFEELIDYIPKSLRIEGDLNIPGPSTEFELTGVMNDLAGKNRTGISFLGGGAYDHFIPAVVRHILLRSEFYTAYTPYQAEVSQGTLQAIYEYQSMISQFTGMEVANASMYDGGSALAESVLMAAQYKRTSRVLIPENIHPYYFDIIRTYTRDQNIEIMPVPLTEGRVSHSALKELVNDQTAAVIVQNPNYFGLLENLNGMADIIHNRGALFIQFVDPLSLGILKTPAQLGADIVISEGQGLGNALNYGGPYLGIFAARKQLIRKMPGRIVAITNDVDNRQAFVTTLQTREQHIRREKATSNICTNSQLCALAALVYMSLLGRSGIKKVAELTLQKSHYLAEKITELDGYRLMYPAPFFKEFVVQTPVPPARVIRSLLKKNIFAGIDLSEMNMGEGLLIAVTEKRTKAEMDCFVEALKDLN